MFVRTSETVKWPSHQTSTVTIYAALFRFLVFQPDYHLRFFSFGYRKIPKISPSKCKPPPGGLYLEIALKYKVKQSKVNFLPTIRLAQSILKRKFPSVHKPSEYKPLQKQALQKGPLKNISPPELIFGISQYSSRAVLGDESQDKNEFLGPFVHYCVDWSLQLLVSSGLDYYRFFVILNSRCFLALSTKNIGPSLINKSISRFQTQC